MRASEQQETRIFEKLLFCSVLLYYEGGTAAQYRPNQVYMESVFGVGIRFASQPLQEFPLHVRGIGVSQWHG